VLLVDAPQPLREGVIGITGKVTLISGIAAPRSGKAISTTACGKMGVRAGSSLLDAVRQKSRVIISSLRKIVRV
jgi:hypothetical protein